MGSLRVALVGGWHVHADDYARQLAAHPEAELTAVWDSDTGRGRDIAARWGCDFVQDLAVVLQDDTVDAVVVADMPARKTETILRCLLAGKHVLTEKLLAQTESEFDDLARAAARSGVQLVTALPFLARPAVRCLVDVIGRGRLGRVTYARVRLSIDGMTAGWLPARFDDPDEAVVGAMGDLGCHPIYVLDLILGEPSSVDAVHASAAGSRLDDHAVILLHYPDGSIGVAEASHVGPPGQFTFTIEVSGTHGALLHGFDGTDDVWLIDTESGRRRLTLPPEGVEPVPAWVRAVLDDEPDEENLEVSRRLTRMVETAGRRSRRRPD